MMDGTISTILILVVGWSGLAYLGIEKVLAEMYWDKKEEPKTQIKSHNKAKRKRERKK